MLELMVVLAILGAVAAVAAPWLSAAKDSAQSAAEVRRVVTLLRGARAEALGGGRAVTVRPLADAHAPATTVFPDGGATAGRSGIPPRGVVVAVEWLGGRVRVER